MKGLVFFLLLKKPPSSVISIKIQGHQRVSFCPLPILSDSWGPHLEFSGCNSAQVCFVSRGQQRFAFHFHVCQCMDVFLNEEETGQEVSWLVARIQAGMGISILAETPLHPGQCCTGTTGMVAEDKILLSFMLNVSLSLRASALG